MEGDIDTLVNDFANSDAGRRSTIIETLQDSSDARVLSLFVKVLQNKSEADFVRVEVLKGLPFRNDCVQTKQRFCDVVCGILNDREDEELVRQYAALAMRYFVELQGVLGLLEGIVRDPDEESSVRYNALSSIERNADCSECQSALRRLVSVPLLGKSAKRTLERLS